MLNLSRGVAGIFRHDISLVSQFALKRSDFPKYKCDSNRLYATKFDVFPHVDFVESQKSNL